VLVRLLAAAGSELQQLDRRRPMPRRPGEPPDPDERRPRPPMPMPETPEEKEKEEESPAAKFYEAKEGFANYYFNKLERDRILAALKNQGDFSSLTGKWTFEADRTRPEKNAVKGLIDDRHAELAIGESQYALEPLKPGETLAALREPRDSGGLLAAMYLWRRFLVMGEKGFELGFYYGGYEPFYPDGTAASRIDCDVLTTEHGPLFAKWYFDRKDLKPVGFECYLEKDDDPCEMSFFDFKDVGGRQLPHRIEVRFAGKEFGVFVIKAYDLGKINEKKEAKQ
jgi:hypothetical protein